MADLAVVLASLAPPAEVVVLGGAARATPGVVYVHQVVRALEGWATTNRREAPWTGRLAALVGATSPAIAKKPRRSRARGHSLAEVLAERLVALLDADPPGLPTSARRR